MLKLIKTNTYDTRVQRIIEALDKELWERIGGKQAQYGGYNIMLDDDEAILIEMDGKPAGSGCLRILDNDKGEIKRMYVHPEHRGKGVGYQILKGLEQLAVENDIKTLILETHPVLKEAIALYERNDYKKIDNYYPYVGNEDSVCMGKNI